MKRGKKTNKPLKKEALLCLGLACLILTAALGVKVAWAAWREPAVPPPQDNIPAPMSIGSETQAKKGNVRLDSNYNPDSPPALVDYPLEVAGTGELVSAVADNLQAINQLYVDSALDKVVIGAPTAGSAKLSVVDGTVKVGTETIFVNSLAVSGSSSGSHGLFGTAVTAGRAGVYGLGASSTSAAVHGKSDDNYGVYGQSTGGVGIYGQNDSTDYAAVYGGNTSMTNLGWAGYFEGRLGAGSDVVSNRFLPTSLRTSLIPFTSGQTVGLISSADNHSVLNDFVKSAFDGTNIWVVSRYSGGNDIYKFRASDGVQLLAVNTPSATDLDQVNAIVFDGRYLWAADLQGRLTQRDAESGAMIGNRYTIGSGTEEVLSLAVTTEGGAKYIWAGLNNSSGMDRIAKIDASNPVSVQYADVGSGRDPLGLAFDGTYVWVLTDDAFVFRYLASDPTQTTSYATTGDYHFHEGIVFDGEYIWIPSYDGNQVIDRLWTENPDDPRHPRLVINLHTYLDAVTGNNPRVKAAGFDGTYIWLASSKSSPNNYLLRIRASVNSDTLSADDYKVIGPLSNNKPTFFTFDGTYLWVSPYDQDPDGTPIRVEKIYTGTGLGHTDLNTVVNLNPASAQSGNINITGSAEIGQGLTVGGDLDVPGVPGNLWGSGVCQGTANKCDSPSDCGGNPCLEDVVNVAGGTADCTVDGFFIKGVTLDTDSKVSGIVCRGL